MLDMDASSSVAVYAFRKVAVEVGHAVLVGRDLCEGG
jgi:hypothetical protein